MYDLLDPSGGSSSALLGFLGTGGALLTLELVLVWVVSSFLGGGE